MALVRWDPTRDIEAFQSDMNRLFDSFFRSDSNSTVRRWAPPTDLTEEGDHLVLKLDLPGMSDEDVDVQVEGNVLTVSGERGDDRKVEEGGHFRLERTFGRFARSFSLPEGIDADAIQGDFDKGVLEIRIPKPVEEQPRKVKIGAGSGKAIEGTSTEA